MSRVGRVRFNAAIILSKKRFFLLMDQVLYRNQFFQRVLSTSPKEYHLHNQNFCIDAML